MDINAAPSVLLPATWTAGTIELRAELHAPEGAFTDSNLANNSVTLPIRFTAKEGLCLVTRPVIQPAQPDAIFHVTEPSFSQIVERFLSFYPVADFRVHENPTPLSIPDLQDVVHLGTIWRALNFEDAGTCDEGARRTHIALVHPATLTPRMSGLA